MRNNEGFDQIKHMMMGTISRGIIGTGIFVASYPCSFDALEISYVALTGTFYVIYKLFALGIVAEKNLDTKHEIKIISEVLNKNVYKEKRFSPRSY